MMCAPLAPSFRPQSQSVRIFERDVATACVWLCHLGRRHTLCTHSTGSSAAVPWQRLKHPPPLLLHTTRSQASAHVCLHPDALPFSRLHNCMPPPRRAVCVAVESTELAIGNMVRRVLHMIREEQQLGAADAQAAAGAPTTSSQDGVRPARLCVRCACISAMCW